MIRLSCFIFPLRIDTFLVVSQWFLVLLTGLQDLPAEEPTTQSGQMAKSHGGNNLTKEFIIDKFHLKKILTENMFVSKTKGKVALRVEILAAVAATT